MIEVLKTKKRRNIEETGHDRSSHDQNIKKRCTVEVF
jgi:hypothetical protein